MFDPNFQNIYFLGDYIHVCETEVNDDFNNDYLERTIRITRIVACRPPEINCLGIDGERWCCNTHSNDNGYCYKHQEQSREFEDIDLDRLLTLGELLNLPKFSSLLNLDFYKSEEKYDDEHDFYRRFHTFDSDTDFSDSDYKYDDDDDYDDRRHGPEGTIEDDDELEEKKEELLTERELYWKEQQEIAELQEEEIIEQDLAYREYAREQMEKLAKESEEKKDN